jgi:hypothetical protein
MHSSLKKGLSWTLSYGIIFSFPAWALLSRIAHAETEEGGPTTAPATSKAAPAANPAPKPADAPKPETKPVTAPAAASKKAAPSKPESHQLESTEPGSEKKEKGETAPKVTSCSDKKMLQNLANGQPNDPGPRCDTVKNQELSPKCWQQVFMLLGAARTNGLVANNSLAAKDAAQQAAAWTVNEGNIIKPNLFNSGKASSNGPKEDELKTVFARMADDSIQDKKQCCKQLVMQAVDLSQWILKKSNEDGIKDMKIHDKIHNLYNKQSEDCDKAQKVTAAPAAGFVAPVAAHNSQAPEKKKSIWPAIFWGLAAGALLFFLLYKRKKKGGGSPPPTPPTPPTTTTTGGTGGTTYPVLTSTTGRDITTGGTVTTGGLTYPADTTGTTGGRDITTGGTGTVTGSTTATTTTSTSTTTGGTTTTSAYPDLSTSGTSRTTDGTTRTISK